MFTFLESSKRSHYSQKLTESHFSIKHSENTFYRWMMVKNLSIKGIRAIHAIPIPTPASAAPPQSAACSHDLVGSELLDQYALTNRSNELLDPMRASCWINTP